MPTNVTWRLGVLRNASKVQEMLAMAAKGADGAREFIKFLIERAASSDRDPNVVTQFTQSDLPSRATVEDIMR
jgi:hypothetical protein